MLKEKGSKFVFSVINTEYVGHIVANGTAMDPEKVCTVASWPLPKSIKPLELFLGFLNYNRFIKGYLTIIALFTELLYKDDNYEWFEQ